MVAPKDDRNDARLSHRADPLFQCMQGALDLAGRHEDIAQINDPQFNQSVHAEREARTMAVVR